MAAAEEMCLITSDKSWGAADVYVNQCGHINNYLRELFYFYDKGPVVDFGRLVNRRSGQCLDSNADIVPCQTTSASQYWSRYKNGMIVNKGNKLCLDLAGEGYMRTYPCIRYMRD